MKHLSKSFVLLVLFLANTSFLNAAGKKDTTSLEQASEMVRLQSKGKVLSARTTNFNGGKAHRIQVLTPSGRVKIFQIPISESKFRSPQHYNPRYTHDKTNIRSNYPTHSNFSNYRTRKSNSHTTSRNHSTSSSGDNKKK